MVAEPGGPQATRRSPSRRPRKLLVLRVSPIHTDIGASVVRVWSSLNREELETVRVFQSELPPEELARVPKQRENVEVEVIRIPPIRLLAWLLLNLRIVYRFAGARFDLIVYNPRTWLSALGLKILGVAPKSLLDIRSVPVRAGNLMRKLEELELQFAMHLARPNGLTFINEQTRDLVLPRSMANLSTAIWGSGVDLRLFTPSDRSQTPGSRQPVRREPGLVMFHGTLSADRGIFELVEAMKLVRTRRPDAHLLLLGGGPSLPELRSRYRELVASRALTLIGTVSYEAVSAYIETADIGVVPLPLDPKWEPQMPLKLLEYLAMGELVVATNLRANQGFGDGVLLVPDNKPASLARGILQALEMTFDERARRVRDSSGRVAAYSWEHQARIIEDLIEKMQRGSAR